jgi:hypothetical protein
MNNEDKRIIDGASNEAVAPLDALLLALESRTASSSPGMSYLSPSMIAASAIEAQIPVGDAKTTAGTGSEASGLANFLKAATSSWSPLLAGGVQATVAPSSAGGSILSSLLNPVLGGLLGVFGHRDEYQAPTPIPFLRPSGISFEYGMTGRAEPSLRPTDHDSSGNLRVVPAEPGPIQTPITIQVQAMDSRSFLDHSNEIADAVRRAIMESHPLNDTLREV